MFVPSKPHPFGNEYHTIPCDKYKVIYSYEIVEGKDQIIVMGKKEFEEKGETAVLMARITNPLWVTGKVVFMDSGLCVLEGFISMVEKDVLGSVLVQKPRYWPKGVPSEEILPHMQNKEVDDVDSVQGSIRGKSYHNMAIKYSNYLVLMMTT